MDSYGHVNNVVFAQYLEEARVDLFERFESEGLWKMLDTGVVVARLEVQYKRPLAHRTTPVPVDIWVTRVAAGSFDLGYEVHDGEGTVYATAMTTLVPYDLADARPRRLTEQEKECLRALQD